MLYHLIPFCRIEVYSLFLILVILPPLCLIWKDTWEIIYELSTKLILIIFFHAYISIHEQLFDSFSQHSSNHTKSKNKKEK